MTGSDQQVADLARGPSDARAAPARLGAAAIVGWMIAALTVVRLITAALVGLDMDGTYSAIMGRTWSLSYFDHPPVHYWMIYLSTHLFGSEAPWVVRLPFILLFAGSSWLMFRVVAIAHSLRAGLWAAVALNLCGAFTLSYSWFVVPDGPLLFFLLLAAYPLSLLAFGEPERHPRLYWLGTGAAGGAAILSKYIGVFFFAGAFLFLLTTPRLRRQLLTPGPWLGLVAALLVFSPVLIWNAQHQWVSFVFQGVRALPLNGGWNHFTGSIVGQLGYLVPWFGLWMAFVLVKSALRGPADQPRWFFVCLATGPIVVFTTLNLLQQGSPHWTMPGWLFVLALLGIEVAEMTVAARAWMTRLAVLAGLCVALGFAGLVVQVRTGALTEMAGQYVEIGKLSRREPSTDLLDWTPVRTEMERRGLTKDVAFVAGIFTLPTTKIGYAFGPSYPLLCLCYKTDMHHFSFEQNEQAFAGKNGFVVVYASEEAAISHGMAENFERFEPPVRVTVNRGATPALQFSVFKGIGFKPFRHLD